MTLIQRLIGCHAGWTSCKWGRFDHEKPMEHLRYRVLSAWERLGKQPRYFALTLADHLARMANGLRGHKSTDIGYGIYGNRAAQIEMSMRIPLVGSDSIRLSRDEADEMLAYLDELANLARATCWQDCEREDKEEQARTYVPAEPKEVA